MAAHYGADAQLLAWGGAGLNVPVRRLTPDSPPLAPAERAVFSPVMGELFTRADALNGASQYDLQAFVPQVRGPAGRRVRLGAGQAALAGAPLRCRWLRAAAAPSSSDPRLSLPTPPRPAQVVLLAAGVNDFRDAMLGPLNHVTGTFAPELAPISGWLDKTEALVRQVRPCCSGAWRQLSWCRVHHRIVRLFHLASIMPRLQIRTAYPQAAIVTVVWPFEQLMAGIKGPKQARTAACRTSRAIGRLLRASPRPDRLRRRVAIAHCRQPRISGTWRLPTRGCRQRGCATRTCCRLREKKWTAQTGAWHTPPQPPTC